MEALAHLQRNLKKLQTLMRENHCSICGTSFVNFSYGIKKWCSKKCALKDLRRRHGQLRKGVYDLRECIICSNVFKPLYKNALCCSSKCSSKNSYKKRCISIIHECSYCKQAFKGRKTKYCSTKCKRAVLNEQHRVNRQLIKLGIRFYSNIILIYGQGA